MWVRALIVFRPRPIGFVLTALTGFANFYYMYESAFTLFSEGWDKSGEPTPDMDLDFLIIQTVQVNWTFLPYLVSFFFSDRKKGSTEKPSAWRAWKIAFYLWAFGAFESILFFINALTLVSIFFAPKTSTLVKATIRGEALRVAKRRALRKTF